MRLLLAFLSFIALALTPLAAPASAMPPSAECGMGADMMDHDGKAASASAEACCVAAAADVPVSIMLPIAASMPTPLPVGQTLKPLRDTAITFDDPPPRS